MKKKNSHCKSILYLASQSARRRDILKSLGIRFAVVPSSYEEKHSNSVSPKELVLQHARGKVRKAIVHSSGQFVLGADTLVYCRGRVMGKPRSQQEAVEMLRFMQGRRHTVWTGMVLWDRRGRRRWEKACSTQVYIKPLDDKKIQNYFKKVDPYDKAGAYAIQLRPKIVSKIKGSYTNVVGLPVEALLPFMKIIERSERHGKEKNILR